MARAHLQNMSREWRSGETPTIAYGDPLCRFAYLYCHTAANANICEIFIRDCAALRQHILNRMQEIGELRICAFGGGPGTELLALTKFLKRQHDEGNLQGYGDLNFTLLDNIPEWAESWNALEGAIRARLKALYGERRQWPFTTSKTFQPFDMTKVEQYANLAQLFVHDLYILNFVVSEILENEEALGNLINRMAEHAPAGAYFLIADRNQTNVVQRSRRLLQQAELHEVWTGESATNMDGDEQATDLGDYIRLIGWNPRVNWNGAFGIAAVKQC